MKTKTIENINKKVIDFKEKINSKLQSIIDERIDYVESRSEKWQESEKCEHYEESTDELDSIKCEIESLFDDIEEKLNEIIEL